MKRIALSRLRLLDGRTLRNVVVEFDGGRPVRRYPLTEELPCTRWIGREVGEEELLQIADGGSLL
ncbi:MAG: hypothetical protein J6N92_01790 [Alloprevotella sp.]|nr:hypothetical protein [Alloprevotella sp.]MBR1445917.1 hypothetical protein [Alloprevotella sp.]